MSVLIYPDAVDVALHYLRPALTLWQDAHPDAAWAQGVAVENRIPTQRPERLVILRHAGGVSPSLTIDRPRIDVQVWHQSSQSAYALAQLVRGLLHQLVGVGPVRAVRDDTGAIPVPDPAVPSAVRYLLSVELTVRGTTA